MMTQLIQVDYTIKNTAYQEHISVPKKLDIIEATGLAFDKVRKANPNVKFMTARQILSAKERRDIMKTR